MIHAHGENTYILWLMSLELRNPRRLLEIFGDAEEIFSNPEAVRGLVSPVAASRISQRANSRYLGAIEQVLSCIGTNVFLSYKSPDFPARLAQIPDAPLGIFVKGALPPANLPAAAIVGARNNSAYGRQVTEAIAKDLARAGVLIVSGMARGLDARAHEGALKAGGATMAVLPCGVNYCYPSGNSLLYKNIIHEGAVVSEYLPDSKPSKGTFTARNRIISGLADVLVVVEAGEKSGTMTTVDHALEQGREIFAVPGSIFNKTSAGTNDLIKQGAQVCTSYLDVLMYLKELRHLLPHFKEPKEKLGKKALASNESLLYDCLGYEPVDIDWLAHKTSLNISEVSKILLNMELAGVVKKLPGQRYIRN